MTVQAQNVPAYIRRMIMEWDELRHRIHNLTTFLDTEVFRKMAREDADLLVEQCQVMTVYRDILLRRISRLPPINTKAGLMVQGGAFPNHAVLYDPGHRAHGWIHYHQPDGQWGPVAQASEQLLLETQKFGEVLSSLIPSTIRSEA